jgi:hypothetical protein
MPVAVTVTHVRDGVSDNKRFVDVSLALSGTYDATQASDGFAVPIARLSLNEVTDVVALPYGGSGGAAGVALGGTKSSPTIKLRTFNTSTGAAVNPANGNTPPASISVRLFGA